ncbi:MAG TPA: glycosyltransferase [Pyrinomonadaceae bacterium]|jgi:glycosyltransferase involved in cell wall biosynthesis|nr:glycosyltransferase [Pyrinomonadaceae bacterium]
MFSGKSIVCFGGEDWWYHHPHSKNHLMRRFARAGNRVIFVNSISMGLPSLAHKDLLPRVARKLRSYAKLARETEEGITVVSPASLPFFGSRAARAANRHLLSAQIKWLARRGGLSEPILWVAIPTAAEIIGRLGESLVVYHVSDKYDANTMDHATDPAAIRRLHEEAIESADLIFYSGRKLLEEAASGLERSYLLEQAVDFEHWSRVGASGDAALEVAAEVARIPRPRLGYFGAIETWLVDQELVKRAARERPLWNWVFIGNKSRGMEIEELPNTHFLPPVSYNDLPRYAAGFDVCVLPWETEQAFTSYGSAIKVREYLATGKPVVISPLPEYEPMRDVLRIARSRDDFFRLVEEALAETGTEAARARQASVAEGTWDARAEWVSALIEEALRKKREGKLPSESDGARAASSIAPR